MPADTRVVQDRAVAHQDLRRPGVTLMLLEDDYRGSHPEGFGFNWFCKHYEAWSGTTCAKAETGVQIVDLWILAALRHQTFVSVSALNTAITALLERPTKQPQAEAGGFALRTESPDTRRLNDAS